MIIRQRATALLAAVALGAGLAACGSSSSGTSAGATSAGNGVAKESPDAILKSASRAAASLTSARVTGTINDSGELISLDLRIAAGVGAEGTMSVKGASFQLVTVKKAIYIKGSKAFLKATAGSAGALLEGRWLKASASGQYAPLVKLSTLHDLLAQIFDASHGKLAKVGTKTIHGTPAIGLRDTTNGGTLYIATTGKPYPVELNGAGAGASTSSGAIDFTDFNAPVKISAPKNAIDLSALESGSS